MHFQFSTILIGLLGIFLFPGADATYHDDCLKLMDSGIGLVDDPQQYQLGCGSTAKWVRIGEIFDPNLALKAKNTRLTPRTINPRSQWWKDSIDAICKFPRGSIVKISGIKYKVYQSKSLLLIL